jgi:hypothetical protein
VQLASGISGTSFAAISPRLSSRRKHDEQRH